MVAPARRLEPVRRPARPDTRAGSPRAGRSGSAAAATATALKPGRVLSPASRARAPKETPRPQLRIVAPQIRRRRAGLAAVAVCGITFLVMLGLTVFQARIAAEQMRLEQLDRAIADEQAISTRLRLQVALAQTPESAAARAQAEGLALPKDGIELYVTPTLQDVVAVASGGAAAAPVPAPAPAPVPAAAPAPTDPNAAEGAP